MNYNTRAKKNITKKEKIIILSFVIAAFILLVSFLLYYFNPRLKYKYDKKSDSYKITRAYGYAKSYTIPSTHKGKKVTVIDKRCFEGKNIETIIFEENSNIETIETRAFYNCSLKNIELPDSVEYIYEGSFSYSKLENFSTSNNSKLKDLAGSTFFNCVNLEFVEIPRLETIGSFAFYNCTNLKSLNLYNDTKIFSRAFVNCNITLNVYKDITTNTDYNEDGNVIIKKVEDI